MVFSQGSQGKVKENESFWAVATLASGRVLNCELYTYKRQKLTLLHLFTDLFRKVIFLTLWNRCQVR